MIDVISHSQINISYFTGTDFFNLVLISCMALAMVFESLQKLVAGMLQRASSCDICAPL